MWKDAAEGIREAEHCRGDLCGLESVAKISTNDSEMTQPHSHSLFLELVYIVSEKVKKRRQNVPSWQRFI